MDVYKLIEILQEDRHFLPSLPKISIKKKPKKKFIL